MSKKPTEVLEKKQQQRQASAKKFWEDFKKFVSRGNVVDMAVGVAVATAFTAIVNAFTKGFISPLLALLGNGSDMTDLKWVIRPELKNIEGVVTQAEVAILWGAFLQAILNFFVVAFALFIVLRVASSISKRAKKFSDDLMEKVDFNGEREAKAKAEAQAKAKAEAEQKAQAEAQEAQRLAELAKEQEEQQQKEAERARQREQNELLREILAALREHS